MFREIAVFQLKFAGSAQGSARTVAPSLRHCALRKACHGNRSPLKDLFPSLRADRCSASTRHATETHILMHVLLRIHPNLSEDSAAERARRPSRLGPARSHPTMDHCALLVHLDKASTEPEQRQQSQGLNPLKDLLKGKCSASCWKGKCSAHCKVQASNVSEQIHAVPRNRVAPLQDLLKAPLRNRSPPRHRSASSTRTPTRS